MKKRIDEAAIMNELKGQSGFFRRPTPLPAESQEASESAVSSPPPQNHRVSESVAPPERFEHPQSLVTPSPSPADTTSLSDDIMTSRHHDIVHDIMTSRNHDGMIAFIRKAVREIGREPTTLRLTPEEKNQLADLVYTYKRQGVKTSENELCRIAINFLLEDYKANGQTSILAKVIASLIA
jgi:hypothetical protein